MREVRRLILGLGNTTLADDGAGVHAARIAARLLGDDSVEVLESPTAGYTLVELLPGYDEAVVLDAMRLSGLETGVVRIFDPEDDGFRPTLHLVAGREVDLATAREMAAGLGLSFPKVTVVGIQVKETGVMRESCTPEVEKALEKAAAKAIRLASSKTR